MFKKITHHPLFIKIFNWEYWPFAVLYAPLYPYWLWLMVKARSPFFFNTANPPIKNGGFLLESKKEIYDLIPTAYYPATLFFKSGSTIASVTQQVAQASLRYPLVGKPDIGMRGMMVQKIEDEAALIAYAANAAFDFLVQEFVSYPNEAGIFYYRYPGTAAGHISGIVGKEFLTVTGNGKDTVQSLLLADQRYVLQLPVLSKAYPALMHQVLNKGESKLLVPYGNHCRGAKFVDITHLADAHFVEQIDAVCRQVPGFYYGRLDVRYQSWEDLAQGKNFSIIELNGAGSEPTHMYDPRHSVFFAWKEIIRHWNILFKISRLNHSRKNLPYMDIVSGIKMFKDNAAYVKLLSKPR
ncbi:MAG: hypothetical protein RL172_1218 [Bacteroidota bacterium]|jgi:hypothetical protein